MVTMVTDGHQGHHTVSGHRLIDIAHRHSVGTNHSRHQNMCRRLGSGTRPAQPQGVRPGLGQFEKNLNKPQQACDYSMIKV